MHLDMAFVLFVDFNQTIDRIYVVGTIVPMKTSVFQRDNSINIAQLELADG